MFIGCGAIVTDQAGAILLVVEGRGVAAAKWSLPAGKLEFGETLVEATEREVREETGLAVALFDLIGVYHSPATSERSYGINFVFRADRVGGELLTSAEHPVVEFVSRATIADMLLDGAFRSDELIERILRDLDGGQASPLDLVRTMAAYEDVL